MTRNDHLADSRPPTAVYRYGLLAAGAILSFLAVHGPFDVALAGWLFLPFLIAFMRLSRWWVGTLWVLLSQTLAGVVWALESYSIGEVLLVAPITALLGVPYTIPFLLDRLAYPRLASRSLFLAALVFPVARVAAEFGVNTVSPFGAIYGSLHHTQTENLPLLQLASITGAYGVSFLIAWAGSVGAVALHRPAPWRTLRVSAAVVAVTLLLTVTSGMLRLNLSNSEGKEVRVAGVTASAKVFATTDSALAGASWQELGKDSDFRAATAKITNELLASTEREARAGAKMVSWPEGATAVREKDLPALLARVGKVARRNHVYVVTGFGITTDRPPYARNVTALVDPQGKVGWMKDKANPTPMEVYRPGDGIVPAVKTPYGTIGGVICFDADFAPLMRQAGAKGVDIMFVPSMDWPAFKQTHPKKALVRAIENGYSLVRQDSKGISVAYDPMGRTVASSDYYQTDQQTMVAMVPGERVGTFYAMAGDVFAYTCLGVLVLLLGFAAVPLRRR